MTDFDPKDLGPYVPPFMLPIRDAAKAILSGRIQAASVFNDNLMKTEGLSEDEMYELAASSRDIPKLYDSQTLQEWSWSELRHRLVAGSCQAFALDENRVSHPLERAFWVSEYGNIALSTGVINPIPLFVPNGEVVISAYITDSIFREYFNEVMDNIEPPYHKLPSMKLAPVLGLSPTDAAVDAERRGPKRQYDVETFLHEAFFLIYDASPMPKTQADLGRRAADAYEAKGGKGGRPSDPWVRATVAKLWHRLDLDQE